MGGNISTVSKRTHLQGGEMKNLFPTVFLLLLAAVICFVGGYCMGQSSLDSTITIQDLEDVQKIPGVGFVSIYSWYGRWEINFDLETKCGRTTIKSGYQSSIKEAINVAKVKASCYDSCGNK